MTFMRWAANGVTLALLVLAAIVFSAISPLFWTPVLAFAATHALLLNCPKYSPHIGLANTVLSALILGAAALLVSNYAEVREQLYQAQVANLNREIEKAETQLTELQKELRDTTTTPLSDDDTLAALQCQFQIQISPNPNITDDPGFGLVTIGSDNVPPGCERVLAIADANMHAQAEIRALRKEVTAANTRIETLANSPAPKYLPNFPDRISGLLVWVLPVLALISSGIAVANKTHEEK